MNEVRKLSDILNIDLSQSYSAERYAGIAEMERKQSESEKIERYEKQAPARYWNESIDTFKTNTEERRKMAETARNFVHSVKCGQFRTLVFLGTVGTGKTHLACGIVREAGGLYRLSPAIVEEIRRAKSFSAKDTEADILNNYGRTPLLVIDEIGRGVAGTDEQYMLYQIINERYNRRKPTVLISNQTKKYFLNYVGIAAADRLTESAQVVESAGKSYRAEIRRESATNATNTTGV